MLLVRAAQGKRVFAPLPPSSTREAPKTERQCQKASAEPRFAYRFHVGCGIVHFRTVTPHSECREIGDFCFRLACLGPGNDDSTAFPAMRQRYRLVAVNGHHDVTVESKSKILDIAEIGVDISCAEYYIYGCLS